MAEFSLSDFKYGNAHYDFGAALGIQNDTTVNCPLETQYISEFQYTNTLNQLCLTGNLLYLDKFGKITQFLSESYPILTIYFGPHKNTDNGLIQNDSLTNYDPLNYRFIVNKIEIKTRINDYILYNFHLVGYNWYNCITNIHYSTYALKNKTNTNNTQPNNILELIKTGITKSGQKINTQNFGTKIKCDITLDYITQNNDNLFSYIKYIMNRLYYINKENQEYDTSIKYLIYNEYKDEYCIGDTVYVANESKTLPNIILSFMYSSSEAINNVKKNNISTVISMPKTHVIKSLQSRYIELYDYNKNSFISSEISSNLIIDYYNSSETFNNFTPKQEKLPKELSANFTQYQTQWNNDINIYTEQLNHLIADNALIVETDGQLNVIPGQYINVIVHKESELEDVYINDNIEDRFLELNGLWCIGSVINKISPANRYYRQTFSLFRNFKNVDK